MSIHPNQYILINKIKKSIKDINQEYYLDRIVIMNMRVKITKENNT